MRILDLGCGAGRIARRIAPHVARLVCCDSSRTLLAEARQNLAYLPNVDFLHTSAVSLEPLQEESVDLAYAQGVFSYLDPAAFTAVLVEVHRVLRPGGWSVINVFTIDQPAGTEYAIGVARTTIRRGRLSGSEPRPYANSQVLTLHRMTGFAQPEVIEPAPHERAPTVFIARRPEARET
ncbi:MAG: class I SAM-dependent methyltransferase [Solirubrobacteraceae bacterium]